MPPQDYVPHAKVFGNYMFVVFLSIMFFQEYIGSNLTQCQIISLKSATK